MDFKVTKSALLEGIQIVQNAVSQKSSLPILSNVLLEAEASGLKITATDLDLGICATVPIEVTLPGAITVPARKFFDIIKTLPEESDIYVSMKKNNFVSIRSGKANFKIIGLPKEEFPQLLFKNKDQIVLESGIFKKMMNLTDFAMSRDDTRFVLNGILLSVKGDKLTMVATDGRRLAAVSQKLAKKTLFQTEIIVPLKTVQEAKRLLSEQGDVEIGFGENQVKIQFQTSYILSRLIEGEFPNYEKVIPQKSLKEIKVSRNEFLSAAQRASIFTDQDSMAIKLNINKKKMTISKNTPYLGEAREELDVDYSGDEDMEIGFNPKYLIDVLKNLDDQEIIFEVEDANKPGVLRKGEEYTYVVLPMQLVG